MSININSLLSSSAIDWLNNTSSTSTTSTSSNSDDYSSLLSSLESTDSTSISDLASLLSDSSSSTSTLESLLNKRTEILQQKYELVNSDSQTEDTTSQLKSLQEQLDDINEQLSSALLEQESSSNISSYLTSDSVTNSNSYDDLSSLFEQTSALTQLKMLTTAKTNLENQSKLLQSEVDEEGDSSLAYSRLQKVNANLELLTNQIMSSLSSSNTNSSLWSSLNASAALTQYQIANNTTTDSENTSEDTTSKEENTTESL
ncbi:hypothetical protein [Rummeliibacillus suwonensis]|uniref:hypothetical protein n=1 Tax=Rummeliibacillus suwonensis TaxID=1306154 RepID=UPI0011B7EEBF|nr:hypothetical protein [Rummeliibacillus suwonensis]